MIEWRKANNEADGSMILSFLHILNPSNVDVRFAFLMDIFSIMVATARSRN